MLNNEDCGQKSENVDRKSRQKSEKVDRKGGQETQKG